MKILITQLQKRGDVLISTIISTNLKKVYPHAQIVYLCYKYCAPILKGHPHIDEVITISEEERHSYFKFGKLIKNIRNRQYDIVIDPYVRIGSNLISIFSGAKWRIAFYKSYSQFFYTHVVKRLDKNDAIINGHAIDSMLNLLKPLTGNKLTQIRPAIFLQKEEHNGAQALLDKFGIAHGSQPLVMFSVIGSEWYKTFPLENMATIIDYTVDQIGAVVIFNYLPHQKEDAQKVYFLCKESTRSRICFDLYAGEMRSFLALLSRCDMLIGNEGGSINMAKALNVPTFSIFSPSTDLEIWRILENAQNVSVHIKDFKPELYKKYNKGYIKKHTFNFFEEYPMELIFKILNIFYEGLGYQKQQTVHIPQVPQKEPATIA